MIKLKMLFCVIAMFTTYVAKAQDVALKTNVLSDALLNINAGAEFRVAPKWTVDISGDVNLWKLSHNRQWRHWVAQPEVRYWFCDPFAGHFVGAHVLAGQYNVGGVGVDMNFLGTDFSKLKHTRFQGWFAGVGVAYGYSWILNKHWNIEAEVGLGWTYTRYDRFRCTGCGKKIDENKPHNYVGPTKLALNLVYAF